MPVSTGKDETMTYKHLLNELAGQIMCVEDRNWERLPRDATEHLDQARIRLANVSSFCDSEKYPDAYEELRAVLCAVVEAMDAVLSA